MRADTPRRPADRVLGYPFTSLSRVSDSNRVSSTLIFRKGGLPLIREENTNLLSHPDTHDDDDLQHVQPHHIA